MRKIDTLMAVRYYVTLWTLFRDIVAAAVQKKKAKHAGQPINNKAFLNEVVLLT